MEEIRSKEQEQLKILFLEPQPCVRALKLAKGLRKSLGDRISLVFGYTFLTLNDIYGSGDEYFDAFVKLDGHDLGKSVKRLINSFQPDIVHSHNAPDKLTAMAIMAGEKVPVVHDNHDVLSLRETGYYVDDDEDKIREYMEQERIANTYSDARVHISREMMEYIRQRYRPKDGKDIVYGNYVSASMVPTSFKEKLSRSNGGIHIVYAGTVSSQIKGHHYDLRHIFKDMASHGLHIHIYASREDKNYDEMAKQSSFIHYHGSIGRKQLMQELTQYDFGWSGFNGAKNDRHLDVALPNKLAEYIACGLPVLSFPHEAQKVFIQEHRVGLVFNDINELARTLREEKKLVAKTRREVLKKRYILTVEGNISRIMDVYGDLVDRSLGGEK